MPQQDLSGRTIDELDAGIARCLEYRERKSTLKTIYPGYFFNIAISAKEADELDDIVESAKRRAFVVAKMKKAKPKEALPEGEEGKKFQTDMGIFVKILWPTGGEHMRPETYQALMAERKPQESEDQQHLPSKKTKELQEVAKEIVKPKTKKEKLVADLENKFGKDNVTVVPAQEEGAQEQL